MTASKRKDPALMEPGALSHEDTASTRDGQGTFSPTQVHKPSGLKAELGDLNVWPDLRSNLLSRYVSGSLQGTIRRAATTVRSDPDYASARLVVYLLGN